MGDLIVASRTACFLLSFTRIGLVPDGGVTFLLPRLVGLARAREMALLADRLTADRALEWGLVNCVVDHSQLMNEAIGPGAKAGRWARRPAPDTRSYSGTKKPTKRSWRARRQRSNRPARAMISRKAWRRFWRNASRSFKEPESAIPIVIPGELRDFAR